ncbi:MAG: potassium transporter [Planctomycetota bacterium]|nr:MAG: potassium transporter [Planctomycetota bacterium]
MQFVHGRAVVLSAMLGLFALASALGAQEAEPAVVQDPATSVPPMVASVPTQAQVEQEIAALREAPDMDETLRAAALAYWEQALSDLKITQELKTAAQAFDAARTDAPTRLETLRTQLASPSAEAELPASGTPLVALQEALDLAQAEAAQAEQALAALEVERTHRAARRAELPALIAQARQSASQPFEIGPQNGEGSGLALAARRASELTQHARAAAQQAAYEAELTSYEARGDLLTARTDAALRAMQRARSLVERLTARVTEQRSAEAGAAARSAAERARGSASLEPVRELAEENTALTARRVEVTALLARMGQLSLEMNRQSSDLDTKRTRVDEKVRIAGFTDSIALLLRRHANELPDPRAHRAALRTRRDLLNAIELETLEVEDERSLLFANLEAALAARLDQLPDDVEPAQRIEAETELRELLSERLTQLTALRKDLDLTFATIVDVNTVQQQLVLAVSDYERFIDEHVLWVVSTTSLRFDDFPRVGRALAWLLDGTAWLDTLHSVSDGVAEVPLPSLGIVLALLCLLVLRPVLRRRVIALGHAPRKNRMPSAKPLLLALFYTLTNSAIIPVVFLLVAWWLLLTGDVTSRAPVLAQAMQEIAPVLFAVTLLRRVALRDGLGEAHLRWSREVLQSLRRNVSLLAGVGVPAAFLARLLRAASESDASDSLGRLAFIVTLLSLALFSQRVLRPEGAVMTAGSAARAKSISAALSRIWFPLVVGVPVLLAIAAGLGYHYTAFEIGERLFDTWLLVLLLVIARSVALRILVIEQRKLRIDQAQRRREAQKADESAGDASSSGSEIMFDEPVDEVDVALVDVQTRRILSTVIFVTLIGGLGWIWAKVLPALGALERVELWSVTRSLLDEGGASLITAVIPISLADLIVALITIGVVVVAVRNIPGLLELAVLRRLPLAPGMSYAITTLVRYVVIASGVVMASSSLGLGWEKVQWLVAAVSVGLGFGLQEIFANFVSGLIILFERPVRMGDVVTVGGLEGVVTRIRIRATTIRDWDRRELLVPNKEFITNQLINWTLTDPITRVIFPVGVAYGSDTALVTKILVKLAKGNPLVLNDPEPSVLFRAFGESSLDFQLRVFIATRDHWPRLTHELNSAIDVAFKEAGVEIPFPQRDVHVRTFGPGVTDTLSKPER